MEDNQQITTVSAVVVFNGKLLLLQRDDNPEIKDPGCWQLPGGGVEDGETPNEAIKRELQEEISVIPVSLRFLMSPSADINAYYARPSDEEVKNIKKGDEGKDLRFFSFEELSNIPLTGKLKLALETQGEALKSLLEE